MLVTRAERDLVILAERTRTLRRRRGLSQVQLAEEAGVGRASVARIELATGDPSLRVLSQIAQALGVSTDQLLRADGE